MLPPCAPCPLPAAFSPALVLHHGSEGCRSSPKPPHPMSAHVGWQKKEPAGVVFSWQVCFGVVGVQDPATSIPGKELWVKWGLESAL